MDRLKVDYNSFRSRKARISVGINNRVYRLLTVMSVLLLILGIVLLLFHSAIGWLMLGAVVMPAMIAEWYRGELHHIPISQNPKTVDDLLSGEVLGRLSKNPTLDELALIVTDLPSGRFFTFRFGINLGILQNIIGDNNIDLNDVWRDAWRIRDELKTNNISAGIILVALVGQASDYGVILSRLKLEINDLIQGLEWFEHRRALAEKQKLQKLTGGIARDWSFGWTPLLSRFAANISKSVDFYSASIFKLVAHESIVAQLINIFSRGGKQNAILVGKSGSGKSEIVRAFAARLMDGSGQLPSNLKFCQILSLDAGAIVAAASDRGGLEHLVPRLLSEAYQAKNVIVCLENAHLFFEEGVGSIDLSNVLMPLFKGGNLRFLLTIDEQRYLEITKRNPEFAQILNRLNVVPSDRNETIAILQDESILIEGKNKCMIMYQAIAAAYDLADRYVYEGAMPAKAVRLLEASTGFAKGGLVTAESVKEAIEKTIGVKVGLSDDENEKQKLLNLEQLIHERMINQSKAVSVVSDALRRARAGVRSQNRPIGTFLFLGPTGVGKTELSKALASVYFGGEDRLVRVDMNEYVTSQDVAKLIASGENNGAGLTARIMKQPFSVVLLDEIEKAHPDVLSTLLQMLDEGILRDSNNHEVSFRDAIIIATSNAGADRIREFVGRGYDLHDYQDKFVDELIDQKIFLPEFLNRFDEIVMFRPLNKVELLQVVDLLIAAVNKTLSQQKISVSVALEAKEYLVDAGYNPQLGARPMRRVIQRAVESIVARQMLSGEVEAGAKIDISLEQVKQIIETKTAADELAAVK